MPYFFSQSNKTSNSVKNNNIEMNAKKNSIEFDQFGDFQDTFGHLDVFLGMLKSCFTLVESLPLRLVNKNFKAAVEYTLRTGEILNLLPKYKALFQSSKAFYSSVFEDVFPNFKELIDSQQKNSQSIRPTIPNFFRINLPNHLSETNKENLKKLITGLDSTLNIYNYTNSIVKSFPLKNKLKETLSDDKAIENLSRKFNNAPQEKKEKYLNHLNKYNFERTHSIRVRLFCSLVTCFAFSVVAILASLMFSGKVSKVLAPAAFTALYVICCCVMNIAVIFIKSCSTLEQEDLDEFLQDNPLFEKESSDETVIPINDSDNLEDDNSQFYVPESNDNKPLLGM